MLKHEVSIYGDAVTEERGKHAFGVFSIRVATRELSSLSGMRALFIFR
ncbi:hypothetical protein PAE4_100008 [Bacillus altitudinis]|nr:hypothetical protein PAE4_100008 [Bacillus altitudinis]